MNAKPNHLLTVTLGAWLIGTSITVSANKPDNITDAEMALAPPYCSNTMGFPNYQSPGTAKWVSMMGRGFYAMHHYCWAIINFHRAERAGMPSNERQHKRTVALGDFWYVVKNTENDFILLPEVFTWIGRTEILLDRKANAAMAFEKARDIKPDYWPAYTHWAEFLLAKGHKAEALAVVKSGLQQAPEVKTLLKLFRLLGGKPGDIPPPIAKKPVAPSPDASTTEPVELPTEPEPAPAAENSPRLP